MSREVVCESFSDYAACQYKQISSLFSFNNFFLLSIQSVSVSVILLFSLNGYFMISYILFHYGCDHVNIAITMYWYGTALVYDCSNFQSICVYVV